MRHRDAGSTAGRILGLLRRRSMTVDEIASNLDLTGNAIRLQLAVLERDGLVRRAAMRRGPSKPAQTYEVNPEAELLFSRAYAPVLTELLHVLSGRLDRREFDLLLREVGRRLSADRPRPTGSPRRRADGAIALLNELGGLARLEQDNGSLIIRSDGCPLAAATLTHPEACNAMESLLTEFVGLPVTKCCDREDRLHCCFELGRAVGPRTSHA
jgi:predicted ArsR family transcriptional regulator